MQKVSAAPADSHSVNMSLKAGAELSAELFTSQREGPAEESRSSQSRKFSLAKNMVNHLVQTCPSPTVVLPRPFLTLISISLFFISASF